ncbi:MAG: phytoene/squalene synthase family protein [Myxococcaceae bacterium]|nr:phytoene/squalene synthase family protein [Myxococcaceae bacterium]
MSGLVRDGYASARALTRHHSKSFFFASLALFGARRRAAFALYAYCRRLDDLVDGPSDGAALPERLAAARAVTTSVFRGAPDLHAAKAAQAFEATELAALADTVQRYSIPEQPMQDLISGMEMDLTPRAYASWAELDLYCYRAAGTVGLLMAPVLGFDSPAALVPADLLGRAMQLTNIMRDVREDLGRGRCYLPQDELRQFGLTVDQLRAGRADDAFRAFMRFQTARARDLYRRGLEGVRHLVGFGSAPTVRIMAAVYGGILDVIEARNFDVFSSRAFVPFGSKLALAARALVA